ncbi:hypothetical protein DM813_15790 [Pseudomonas alkylphenolica]|uniref:Uncharacterized protein n=1 Tax=Pseudomonas alkylphenolica TaxID=237609 RepID=A0A443ZNM4_9PSED|nr:hypothetical protein [Pseudomonas alkylphenolica]RWU20691.1 hypothetical protein DM813_15790 [Pseudomonas alkylphenolica]
MNRTLLLLNALALTALIGLIFQPQGSTPSTPQAVRINAPHAQLTVLDATSRKATAATLPTQRLPSAPQGRLVF